MINSKRFLEKFLQNYRFRMVKSYLTGDVLDFGGNEGELKKYVTGKYTVINYDHSQLENESPNTIVALAVMEHIEIDGVYGIFMKFKKVLKKDGIIFLTTPTKMAKPVLEIWAFLGIVDRKNIEEHKHYWTKEEILDLAEKTGFVVEKYRKFQFGFNQMAVLRHNSTVQ